MSYLLDFTCFKESKTNSFQRPNKYRIINMWSLTLSGLGSLHFYAEGLMVKMESLQDCDQQTWLRVREVQSLVYKTPQQIL